MVNDNYVRDDGDVDDDGNVVDDDDRWCDDDHDDDTDCKQRNIKINIHVTHQKQQIHVIKTTHFLLNPTCFTIRVKYFWDSTSRNTNTKIIHQSLDNCRR